jgi:hypothetical protein
MLTFDHRLPVFALTALSVALYWVDARGETFRFGRGINGFDNTPSATLVQGDVEMTLAPFTPGAVMTEVSSAGMGINTQPVVGSADPTHAVFNLIGGDGPLAGSGEALVFSFNRPGVLTGIDFDGIKDELLEYFLLESESGVAVYFFDSTANMPDVPNLVHPEPLNAAIGAGVISGDVVLLWEVDGLYDDEVYGLSIPFAAGEQFTLTFGAVPPPFSQGASNGARLQGITISTVPEPAMGMFAAAGAIALAIASGRSGRLAR